MILSIIIPTLNHPTSIYSTVKSIEDAFVYLEKKIEIEIIIVNQTSLKKKIMSKNDFIKINYIHSNIKALSKSRNIGIRNSVGEVIIFLDDDVRIEESYLNRVVKTLKEDDSISIVAAKLVTDDCKKKKYSHHQRDYAMDITLKHFYRVLSAGLVVRKNIINKIGLFDEKFGLGQRFGGSEEADLIIRAISEDIKVLYDPSFLIIHPEDENSIYNYKEIFNKGYSYGMGRGALFKKHQILRSNIKLNIINFTFPIFGAIKNFFSLKFSSVFSNFGQLIGRLAGYYEYK